MTISNPPAMLNPPGHLDRIMPARTRWQMLRHSIPFGIAVSAFNVRMNFPADLPASDREHLIHVAHIFAHVLRGPALLTSVAAPQSFDAWAAAIARQYDLQHPQVYSAVQLLRRVHQASHGLSSPATDNPGKARP